MKNMFTLLICLLALSLAQANNVQVANVGLTGQVDGTTQIQFDLSWENSWRVSLGPANYDAVWVFAKFRVNGQAWQHATLASAEAQTAAGAQLDVVDNMGAFVYRDADGFGDVAYSNLQLRWNYDDDGIAPDANVEVEVFAIEMVYVPERAFFLGTTTEAISSTFDAFYTVPDIAGNPLLPYEVNGEGAITVNNTAGNLSYFSNNQTGLISADFPKGYAAFYCQKYETTQEQWTAFFNLLSATQKTALDITDADGKNSDAEVVRNAVSWNNTGDATTSLANVPVTHVTNARMLSYLDWTGLRPMTELEFEKACRGHHSPVAGEFAWGTANINSVRYSLTGAGTANEVVTNPASGMGNASYRLIVTGFFGPVRVGIFAASAGMNDRQETGSSYYGIMELSGNVRERAVSAGTPEGRAFIGNHGDGSLPNSGISNVPGWPIINEGLGHRGGQFNSGNPSLVVANREAAVDVSDGNSFLTGFRGVRTAQ